jgi:hypothetical protein
LETGYNGSAYPDLGQNNAGTNNAGNTAPGVTANTSCTLTAWNTSGSQNVAINTQAYDACSQGGVNDITIVTNNTTGSTVNAYAIYGHLVSNTGGYFCIDSSGRTNPAESSVASSTCQ